MAFRSTKGLLGLLLKPGALTVLGFGLSGLAFIGANLLLARVLPVNEYAVIALLVSIGVIAGKTGPVGADGVINRQLLPLDSALLRRIVFTSCVAAAAAVAVAAIGYHIDGALLFLLALSVVAQGVIFSVAARYQALQAFVRSLSYLRSPDFALLIGAGVALAAGDHQALLPFAALTLALVTVAMIGASGVHGVRAKQDRPGAFSFKEALTYLSVQLSADGLMQLERLAAPALLSLKELATLGLVLAIVGPPFRLLQMTTGYALQPRLRLAHDSGERMRLLVREGLVAAGMVAVSCVVIWFFAQELIELTVGGKYQVSKSLLCAALVSGVLKVASGFAKASATALATNRELAYIGVTAWVGLAAAVVAAWWGARYGLQGIIYGVGVGWAIRVLAVGYFVARHIRPNAS